jgi:autotransporter-associated beta strand protein
VVIGDGSTVGGGSLSGPLTLGGTLVLNRPDDATFALAPTGTGNLRKKQASSVTLSGAAAVSGPVEIEAGKLAFSGGGTLSGLISGAGQLESAGGTLALNGSVPNTFTGLTTVSAGALQLSNFSGLSVGGDVTVTGSGTLAILANEQIPDTATLRILGTSADSLVGTTGTETVANVIVNPSVPTGQLVMRNGFTVSGLATLNLGVLGAASSHTATLNALVMTGGTLRVAGSGGPSVLNIGPGGITASGGVIEVKFNTNAQDSTLNLGGDFTATANIAINNAGFTGTNLNVINLIGERIFNLASGTTTTVAPDIGGTGTLTKTGGGTLVLSPSCSTAHAGTTVNDGTLIVNGSIGDVTADGPTAVIGGNGTAGTVTVNTGATVSPGQGGTGRLTVANLTVGPAGKILCEAISNGNNDSLNITGSLTLDGTFTFAATSGYVPALGDRFDLLDAATVVATNFDVANDLALPTPPSGLVWDTSAFLTTGVVTVVSANPYLAWKTLNFTIEEQTDSLISGESADPDHDGIPNALEFALGSLPRSVSPADYRPVASLSSGALRLTFRRPVGGVSGVTYGFNISTQANTGWAATSDYALTTQANGDNTETVTVTFGPTAATSRFAQLSVSY